MHDKKKNIKQFINGKIVDSEKPFSPAEMTELIKRGRRINLSVDPPRQEQIVAFFSRLFNMWSDLSGRFRRAASDILGKNSGIGPSSIELVLNEFPKFFSPENIVKKIEGELGSARIQDEPVFQKTTNTRLIVRPAGLVLHVVAGNVFLMAVESLIDGIIARNVNYLKMSSDESEFPMIFAQSMMECDTEEIVCKRISLLWWQGGDEAIENIFKQLMDRIVFWGGYEALSNWKKNLGPETIIVQHGPKVSFGVVSMAGLDISRLDELTDRIAMDMSIWEQKACNCPQMLFIENTIPGDRINMFIDSLSEALKKMNTLMPPDGRSGDDYVEVLRARELALAKDHMTNERVSVFGPDTLDWTIIYQKKSTKQQFELSPLNRTIIIKHYLSLDFLADIIKEQAFYLQTVGYCLSEKEVLEYALVLSKIGVTRIAPFGRMLLLTAGTPHDGSYALRDLTRFTVIE
ncbi:MAG: hypothetical protein NTY34_01020 [Candidatus Omnitrophica bacterium]|nr:hypothetical protein [Candidatus Omnitrophota bacterium]